jgi:hypothetical protein
LRRANATEPGRTPNLAILAMRVRRRGVAGPAQAFGTHSSIALIGVHAASSPRPFSGAEARSALGASLPQLEHHALACELRPAAVCVRDCFSLLGFQFEQVVMCGVVCAPCTPTSSTGNLRIVYVAGSWSGLG